MLLHGYGFLPQEGKLMEVRDAKVIFNKSGGTSSQGGYTTRVTIPISWIKQMGISPDDRKITISFDGEKIIIEKKL